MAAVRGTAAVARLQGSHSAGRPLLCRANLQCQTPEETSAVLISLPQSRRSGPNTTFEGKASGQMGWQSGGRRHLLHCTRPGMRRAGRSAPIGGEFMLRRAPMPWIVSAALGTLALLASQRGSPGSYLPHGYCFTWNPTLLWTHVASDTLIGAAYVSIPVTLLHLVRRRTDLPFNWIVLLFALFIVSCGATHWVEVWTVWNPDYWLAGSVKVVTAAASVLTAAALVYLVPRILAIPTVAQLTAAKEALEAEVAHRRHAEDALLRERSELERRVAERTVELAQATAEARLAHAAAEEANRQKDRFLAKVSHELRTPLQATLSWAHVLTQTPPDDTAALRHAADRIIHNARSQARLIDDLLDISRILSGNLALHLERVDATAVVRKAVDVVRPQAARHRIEVEVVGDGRPAPLHTDPVRLEQVVWNLVNNAVQATPDGGRVRVALRNDDDSSLEVAVQDWGHGINPADLGLIFEPFRQGGGTPNAHRGLGLGLAIARSLADLFGGTLHASSDGPGRGALFRLRLPLDGAPAATAPAAVDALFDADRARLAALSVLYVEDEPDIAESEQRLLASMGIRVVMCTEADAALRRIAEGGFDVLLSDLNLCSGRAALELAAAQRRRPGGERVPVIVLSADGTEDDHRATREAGVAAHLVKPVDPLQLARALLDASGRPGGAT